jgi:hypothetical protein
MSSPFIQGGNDQRDAAAADPVELDQAFQGFALGLGVE